MTREKESGFSAIELLITLFVLAAFLIAGVQLYNVVINDGAASRAESRASNLAYGYLRQFSTAAENPCEPSIVLDDESVEVQGLVDVSVTVSVICPYGTSSSVSKVEAAVSYNRPSQTVVHATFVNDGSNVAASSVTNGLVAWWKLNGNANDSIGNANGTVSDAVPATGADDRANGAYMFNGSSSYIEAPQNPLGSVMTISLWFKATNLSGTGMFVYGDVSGGDGLGGEQEFHIYQSGAEYRVYMNTGTCLISNVYLGAIPDTNWHQVTFTLGTNASYVSYVDGSMVSSGSASCTPDFSSYKSRFLFGKPNSPTRYLNGTLDDVRIYNRVLSSTEAGNLFTEGAF